VTTWHDIRDPNDPKLDELAAMYGLHPLHIEDCRHRNQNAKIEPQDNYVFVVVKPIETDPDCIITAGDLDIFLGTDYIITVQETECSALKQVLARTHSVQGSLRPDQIFYRVLDGIVDSYLPILDRFSDEIDELEDQVLENPEPEMLERLFDLRRALIQLRRIMANSRDVMGHILRNEYPQVSRDLAPFFRDVYDHVARNLDAIEIHRDLLTGAMELYLSSVANRTNQVMKVLTVFGTIATPALVITGLYGMNLQHLPFANHPHSWGIVMTMIAAVSAVMLFALRKMHWI
jgi:magnesium transporter